MPGAVPDLIDEVDEELRAERAARLAKRFGGLFATVALLVLAGVGGWQGWKWYESRQAGITAEAFLASTRDASVEGADTRAIATHMASIANDAPTGYRVLTRLRAAALAAEAGDKPAALAIWNQVSADAGADPLYRDLATLMWATHALEPANAAEIRARITPLANGPWRASAREILALAALAGGQNDEARRALTDLARDDAAPQGVRDRAQRLLTGIDG